MHVNARTRTQTHTCTHRYTHTHTDTLIHTDKHDSHTHTVINTLINTYTHTHADRHKHRRINTHRYKPTHTHTHRDNHTLINRHTHRHTHLQLSILQSSSHSALFPPVSHICVTPLSRLRDRNQPSSSSALYACMCLTFRHTTLRHSRQSLCIQTPEAITGAGALVYRETVFQ